MKAAFTNTYSVKPTEYSLSVSKTLKGDTPRENDAFTFELKENEAYDGVIMPSNTDVAVRAGETGSFATIMFTKPGTFMFTVSEQNDKKSGYTYDDTVYTVKVIVEDIDSELTVTSVTMNGKDYKDTALEFVNTYFTGGLTVSKTVTGSGDKYKEFTFTVKLSDKSINGIYGDMEFVNGVATFMLKHGESKTATELPVGVTYTVVESNNEGYEVSSTGDTGTISKAKIAKVAFTNHMDTVPDKPSENEEASPSPSTGDEAHLALYITLLILSGSGIILLIPMRKRFKKER